MLFKKRSAPSFHAQQNQTDMHQNISQNARPAQSSAQSPPKQRSPSASKEQFTELQTFMQLSYQAVADYELLRAQMPTQHLASIIQETIEEEKNHYQIMLHLYKLLNGKEPSITEPIIYRNRYVPALKKAFEQEQKASALFEHAARFATVPQLRDVYASFARDQQRHAIWLLSYLTIYPDHTEAKS